MFSTPNTSLSNLNTFFLDLYISRQQGINGWGKKNHDRRSETKRWHLTLEFMQTISEFLANHEENYTNLVEFDIAHFLSATPRLCSVAFTLDIAYTKCKISKEKCSYSCLGSSKKQ